jgi:hypothetical protein
MRISIEQYIAVENPNASSQFLTKYGVPAATSLKDLADKMAVVTFKYRDLAFADLAAIDTPYRRLILDSIDTKVAVATLLPENVSNCDGACSCNDKVEKKSNCSGGCDCKKSNAEGDSSESKIVKKEVATAESTNSNSKAESMDKYIMPTLAIVVIAALIIAKK